MTDREKVIKGLEEVQHYIKVENLPAHTLKAKVVIDDALALLKEHEKATIEPKRIDLPDETKAWLDKMDTVDALGNIADICMDWDGYRTANGLGELINEIWAYARYCADRLQKAQEPVVRCKDCMYWKSDMLTHFWKPCDVVSTDKDGYCPCGKQRCSE